jgi:hypothetical protein
MRTIKLISVFCLFSISQLFAQSWEVIATDSINRILAVQCESYNGDLYSFFGSNLSSKIYKFDNDLKIWIPTQILAKKLKNAPNKSTDIRAYFKNLNDTSVLILLGNYGDTVLNNITATINYFYLYNWRTNETILINSFYGTVLNQKNGFCYNGKDLYMPVNNFSLPYTDEGFDVVKYNAQGVDTIFHVYRRSMEFLTPYADGFIYEASIRENQGEATYYYNRDFDTSTLATMNKTTPVSGVVFQSGALMKSADPLFGADPSPTRKVTFFQYGALYQNWGNPTFLEVGDPIKYKGEVYFPTRVNNAAGQDPFGIHKFIGPNVFQKLPYTERFSYNYSGAPSMLEFLAVDKDYLYAKAGDKMDSIVYHGIVRYPLLNSANVAPIANNDTYSTNDTSSILLTMRANDSDANNDYLYSELLQEGQGTVEIQTNYDFLYTPLQSFSGNDTIRYRVCDLGGLCSMPAMIVIALETVGSKPLLRNDTLRIYKSASSTINIALNDDYQNEDVSIEIVANVQHGSITVNNDSVITYAPNTLFLGEDSLEYQVCKTYNFCEMATVYFLTVDHPYPPVCLRDTYLVSQTSNFIMPLANDFNPTGGPMSLSITKGPFSLTGFGSQPTTNTLFYGQNDVSHFEKDSIEYQACNASGLCAKQWMVFTSTSLGVDESTNNFSFNIFPNPVSEELHIETDHEIAEVQILDLQGKQLLQTKETKSISTISLSQGMYLLKVKTQNGTWKEVRFVKE